MRTFYRIIFILYIAMIIIGILVFIYQLLI